MHIPRKHYEMDMTSGPLLGKIVRFSLPLMATGVLQLLYNAADIVVVGQFAGSSALAAVGSTGALINLIVSVFMGLSTGVSVAVARHYGAGQYKDVSETVHTAVALSLICGTVVGVFGLLTASSLLQWMGTPENVLDAASLYMRILFIGMPVNMLYNFGAAVLRAVGDTRRPLIYLSISGMVNVLLNLVFVILFHMDVEGVAIATVVSQVISAVLVTMCLIRSEGSIRLFPRKIRVHVSKLWPIARIGLPAGVQGSIFSVSNVLIQSSINSFGSLAMAGNTAGANLEGFISTAMNAFSQAALTFSSQNMGARKPERIRHIVLTCTALVTGMGILLGLALYAFGDPLLSIYVSGAEDVFSYGMTRITYCSAFVFLCGLMDLFACEMRGLGYSVLPMVVSILGACVFRIIWIYTVFAASPTLPTLYISYPISWALTSMTHIVCFLVVRRKQRREVAKEALA